MNIYNYPILKIAFRYLNNFSRTKRDIIEPCPIILNTIPKSGTYKLFHYFNHLNYKNYYNFISSLRSWDNYYYSSKLICNNISKLFTSEMVASHIFYDTEVFDKLSKMNIPFIFLYRDPKDILLSEINYIKNMNNYHFLHKFYQNKSFDEILYLNLHGFKHKGLLIESFDKRIQRYTGWLSCENILCIKYENLQQNPSHVFDQINSYLNIYKNKIPFKFKDLKFNQFTKSINTNSHTLSKNKYQRFNELISNQQDDILKLTKNVRSVLGYVE